MKRLLLLMCFHGIFIAHSQPTICGDSNGSLEADVLYVADYTNTSSPLVTPSTFNKACYHGLKIYGAVDNGDKPAILLFHGGGFHGGNFNEQTITTIATALDNDFVVISANYFLDCEWKDGDGPGCYDGATDVDVASGHSLFETIYMGTLDARMALRYIIANHNDLGINTNHILVGGTSAGATVAWELKYLQKTDVPSVFGINPNTFTKTVSLPDFSYPASNANYTYNWQSMNVGGEDISFKVAGVLSFWGGLLDCDQTGATTCLDYLSSAEKVPTLMVHGTEDGIIPIGHDRVFYSTNSTIPYINGPDAILDHMDNDLGYNKVYSVRLIDACHNPTSETADDCTNHLVLDDRYADLILCFTDHIGSFSSPISDDYECDTDPTDEWENTISNAIYTCTGPLKQENTARQKAPNVYYSNGHIYINGVSETDPLQSFQLMDLLGRRVMENQIIVSENTQILAPDIPSGIYLFRLSGTEEFSSGKISIEY